VVYISPFKVGVSSVMGSRSEEEAPMFPAPPRPWEEVPGREEEEERRSERWTAAILFNWFGGVWWVRGVEIGMVELNGMSCS